MCTASASSTPEITAPPEDQPARKKGRFGHASTCRMKPPHGNRKHRTPESACRTEATTSADADTGHPLRLQGVADRRRASIRIDRAGPVLALRRPLRRLALCRISPPSACPIGRCRCRRIAFAPTSRNSDGAPAADPLDLLADRGADGAAGSRLSRLHHWIACAPGEGGKQGGTDRRAWAARPIRRRCAGGAGRRHDGRAVRSRAADRRVVAARCSSSALRRCLPGRSAASSAATGRSPIQFDHIPEALLP